jgi:predicted O-methyltransferase YrrM
LKHANLWQSPEWIWRDVDRFLHVLLEGAMTRLQRLVRMMKTVLDVFYWPRLIRQRIAFDKIHDWTGLVEQICRRRDRRSIFANQNPAEIGALCDLVRQNNPKVILEIGTSQGGTLYLFSRLVEPGGLVISIDKPGEPGSVRYVMRSVYQTFGKQNGAKVLTLDRDSHSPETHRELEQILAGRQIDLLFIDGDHRYDGVKADYQTYRQWIAPGGIIALHDIAIQENHATIDVPRFWRELVASSRSCQEFVARPGEGPGIGVISDAYLNQTEKRSA